MRRAILALVAVALVVLALLGPHGTMVAAKTLLFIPEIFPSSPIRPIAWLTPSPRVERFEASYPGGTVEADIYVPGGGGRHGAIIMALGARPIANDAPVVVRFADGLSRLGIVVMVPESSGLTVGKVTRDEIDLLVREFEELSRRPDVDPQRIGFIGLSVGGSLALVAASDARIADRVAFVNAFGAYFDVLDLLVAVSSQSMGYAGVADGWEPAQLTRQILAENLVSGLDSEREQAIFRRIFLEFDEEARTEIESLSETADSMIRLLDGVSTEQARAIVEAMPRSVVERLQAVSPRYVINRLRTSILVMHDMGDRYIPYTESRRLVASLPDGRLRQWTEFNLFDHVMPERGPDSPQFLVEVARLYRHAYLVCREIL